MAKSNSRARTWEDVQDPMKYDLDYTDEPFKDSSRERARQKGFKRAESIETYIKPYINKNKPRSEIDPFMQWDKPREER